MDEATYRILDILSRRLGIPMSINEITKNIREIHGGTYYANTHKKIKELDREEILTLARAGRSSLVSLNFDNYVIIGMLAEMELRRKHDFLKGKQEMQMLMLETDTCLRSVSSDIPYTVDVSRKKHKVEQGRDADSSERI